MIAQLPPALATDRRSGLPSRRGASMFQLIRTLSASHLLARQLPVRRRRLPDRDAVLQVRELRAGVRGLPGHLVRAGRDRAGRRAPVRAGGGAGRRAGRRAAHLRLTQRPTAARRNPGSASSASGGIVWAAHERAEVHPQAGRREGVADHLRALVRQHRVHAPVRLQHRPPGQRRGCRPQRARSSGAPDSRQSPAQPLP